MSTSGAHEGTTTITVFFEGTANPIRPVVTQIGELFALCDALDVTDPQVAAGEASHLKMGFDGCGVVAGLPGALFAFGLAPQCDAVVARLEALASSSEACRQCLSVNVLGLSRGGIAALQLAKKLESASTALRDRLRLALLLFDPVPGNLVFTARHLDFLAAVGMPGVLTTASGVLDLSASPVSSVLAVYPHEPLPDIAFHAPLLPASLEANTDSRLPTSTRETRLRCFRCIPLCSLYSYPLYSCVALTTLHTTVFPP